MTTSEIAYHFGLSFAEASGHIKASVFSDTIRLIAIVFTILAVMWSIHHFMRQEERHHDTYLMSLGSRIVKLVIGLMLFILLLTQGK